MSDWTEAEYKAILTHKPQDPATKKITTIETMKLFLMDSTGALLEQLIQLKTKVNVVPAMLSLLSLQQSLLTSLLPVHSFLSLKSKLSTVLKPKVTLDVTVGGKNQSINT